MSFSSFQIATGIDKLDTAFSQSLSIKYQKEEILLKEFFSKRGYDTSTLDRDILFSMYHGSSYSHIRNIGDYTSITEEYIEILNDILTFSKDSDTILGRVSNEIQQFDIDIFILFSDRVEMNREQILKMFNHNLFSSFNEDEAKRVSNLFVDKLHDGDLLPFEHQTLHVIKDEGAMKILPQENYGNFNTMIPMYLISKYPDNKGLTGRSNTSLFLDLDMIKGGHKYKYIPKLDSSVLDSLQNRKDFTDEQLLIVDCNAIVLANKRYNWITQFE